jgi:hypothetical protein
MSLPFLCPKTLENGCTQLSVPPCCHIPPLHISHVLKVKQPIEEFNYTLTRITLIHCCHYCNVDFDISILSHATLILYHHTSVSTRRSSVISRALSVVTCMILGKLVCISRPPYQGCVLHPHNPFDSWSWSLVLLDPSKGCGPGPSPPSLDISLPKCTSLGIWNYGIHVNILSCGSVNAVCLELHASTFALLFENYNLLSIYIYIHVSLLAIQRQVG